MITIDILFFLISDIIFLYFTIMPIMTLSVPKALYIQQVCVKKKKKYSRHYFHKIMLQRIKLYYDRHCAIEQIKNCLFFNITDRLCDQKSVIIHLFYLNCAWYNYFVEYTYKTELSTLIHFFFFILNQNFYFLYFFFLSFVWIKQIRHIVPLTLAMLL